MEFADNGDLYQKISNHLKKGVYIKESEIWGIFIEVLNNNKNKLIGIKFFKILYFL